MSNAEEMKKLAGEKAAEYVETGMIVGLGTGSTVYYTILKLGELVQAGELEITGIPTSIATEKLAREQGIKIGTLEEYPIIDLTIDGADEVDPNLNLIKGMGGALLREKIVAMVSKREIIIADGSKEVQMLGTKSALPVEILPFALAAVKPKLEELCVEAILRERDGQTFVSDNGNYIIDCRFDAIAESEETGFPLNANHKVIGDPEELESRLNNVPGVVENGLFLGLADLAILGTTDGLKILE